MYNSYVQYIHPYGTVTQASHSRLGEIRPIRRGERPSPRPRQLPVLTVRLRVQHRRAPREPQPAIDLLLHLHLRRPGHSRSRSPSPRYQCPRELPTLTRGAVRRLLRARPAGARVEALALAGALRGEAVPRAPAALGLGRDGRDDEHGAWDERACARRGCGGPECGFGVVVVDGERWWGEGEGRGFCVAWGFGEVCVTEGGESALVGEWGEEGEETHRRRGFSARGGHGRISV